MRAGDYAILRRRLRVPVVVPGSLAFPVLPALRGRGYDGCGGVRRQRRAVQYLYTVGGTPGRCPLWWGMAAPFFMGAVSGRVATRAALLAPAAQAPPTAQRGLQRGIVVCTCIRG